MADIPTSNELATRAATVAQAVGERVRQLPYIPPLPVSPPPASGAEVAAPVPIPARHA